MHQLIAWVVWLVTVVWLPLLLAAPWLALAALWQLGRTHGHVPAWAAPTRMREQEGVVVTPGGVATALAHLGIGKLNEAVKKGWEVEFLTPPVRVNSCGYHAAFSLPMGVTPDMIADRRDVLARNLNRALLEVRLTQHAAVALDRLFVVRVLGLDLLQLARRRVPGQAPVRIEHRLSGRLTSANLVVSGHAPERGGANEATHLR